MTFSRSLSSLLRRTVARISQVMVLLPLLLLWPHDAHGGRLVTVMTRSGETVEGVLSNLNSTEITVEIAGTPLLIPLENVRYLSFEGKIDRADAPAAKAAPTLEASFEAFREIDSAIRVGILRPQYGAKLQETLPRVASFVDSPAETRRDVRLALERAMYFYQLPLENVNFWTRAPTYWRAAQQFAVYAKSLSQEDKEGRQETPTNSDLRSGEPVKGRLGFGDTRLPRSLTAGTSFGTLEAVADVYRLTIDQPSKVQIVEVAQPCLAIAFLVNEAGERIDYAAGTFDSTGAIIERKIKKPGQYAVWASCQHFVGAYLLMAQVTPLK